MKPIPSSAIFIFFFIDIYIYINHRITETIKERVAQSTRNTENYPERKEYGNLYLPLKLWNCGT